MRDKDVFSRRRGLAALPARAAKEGCGRGGGGGSVEAPTLARSTPTPSPGRIVVGFVSWEFPRRRAVRREG